MGECPVPLRPLPLLRTSRRKHGHYSSEPAGLGVSQYRLIGTVCSNKLEEAALHSVILRPTWLASPFSEPSRFHDSGRNILVQRRGMHSSQPRCPLPLL